MRTWTHGAHFLGSDEVVKLNVNEGMGGCEERFNLKGKATKVRENANYSLKTSIFLEGRAPGCARGARSVGRSPSPALRGTRGRSVGGAFYAQCETKVADPVKVPGAESAVGF